MWIKAHVGIPENEHVDSLAKDSISNGIESCLPISAGDTTSIFKNRMKRDFKQYFDDYKSVTNNTYGQLDINMNSVKWFEKVHKPRRFITTIIRMRFGHACYPKHLHKIGILTSPDCENCRVIGDLNHIFFKCSKYDQKVENLIKKLVHHGVNLPVSIPHLLSLGNVEILALLVSFLGEVGLKL